MPRLIYTLCFIFLLLNGFSVRAQTDTEFWFAAPEVAQLNQWNDRPIMLYITTYVQDAVVTISQPASNDTLNVVRVSAGNTHGTNLTQWIDRIEIKPANTVLPYGLLISSTSPVTIYYEVESRDCKCNPEFFVLKGKNSLGTEFWIPSQNTVNNAVSTLSPAPGSSFDIIATQDNTTVNITPARAVVGHPANTPYVIRLDAGEVYSAAAVSGAALEHLAGSYVTSDKPIAITVKDDYLWFGPNTCADLIGDQIIPVSIIGKEYIAVQGFLDMKDILYVTATKNATDIYQDGSFVRTMAQGETISMQVVGLSSYIKASEPIYVWQLTGIGCELGATVLPTITCTGSYSVSLTRSSDASMIINLLVRKEGRAHFQINGKAGLIDTADFDVVPGTGGLYYTANIDLPVAIYKPGNKISVTNSAFVFHLGVLHGTNFTGTGFGYFSNYGNIEPVMWADIPACNNESLVLHTYEADQATYRWTGPNGFRSADANPKLSPASPSLSGTYTLTMQTGICTGIGSLDVTIDELKQAPVVDVKPDTLVACLNSTITLTATGAATYSWLPVSGLTGFYSPVATAKVQGQTAYVVTGTAPNGCKDNDTAFVMLGDTVFSANKVAICSDAALKFGALIIKDTGTYLQYFKTREGCDSAATVHISFKKPPVADFSFSPAVPQLNEPIQFFDHSIDAVTSLWDFGDNSTSTEKNPVYLHKRAGLYHVCLTARSDEQCPHTICKKIQAEVYPNVHVPDAFSPNGDGANDILYLYGGAVQEVHLKIFNRWGQLMFETRDMKTGWDGRHNGQEQEMDVYAYSLSAVYIDGNIYQTGGNITLIR